MKKFTLFFMSLFLAFGTAMAQEEPAEFSCIYMEPANGAKKSQVNSIYMVFSKDITIAIPEGGIDVVNTETQEVVKITTFYMNEESTEHKEVTFYFNTQLSAGNWTCTIPEGVITSVNNEVYPETTVSFGIMSTFNIEGHSPQEASSVETIVVTFDREITEAKIPTRGLEVLQDWWKPVTKVIDITINQDDKKSATLTLENPITAIGYYSLGLSEGTFISGDAVSLYYDAWFSVIDPTPRYITNYAYGDKVKELGNLEITFQNVTEVKPAENAEDVYVYVPGGSDFPGTATYEGNKITVTFEKDFTNLGEYKFHIPAGMFLMDGVPNEERLILVELFKFEVKPLEVIVTPSAGNVDKIERVLFRFNQNIQLATGENDQLISLEIFMTCGDKKYTLTRNGENWNNNEIEYLVNAEYNMETQEYTIDPITEEGDYSIDLKQIVVNFGAEDIIDEYGYNAIKWHEKNFALDGTYTLTIGDDAAVENIKVANGEQAIYDLLGRRVETITGAGIYIVNGKKVIVK